MDHDRIYWTVYLFIIKSHVYYFHILPFLPISKAISWFFSSAVNSPPFRAIAVDIVLKADSVDSPSFNKYSVSTCNALAMLTTTSILGCCPECRYLEMELSLIPLKWDYCFWLMFRSFIKSNTLLFHDISPTSYMFKL